MDIIVRNVNAYKASGAAYLYIAPSSENFTITNNEVTLKKTTRWRYAPADFQCDPDVQVFLVPIDRYTDLDINDLCLERDNAHSLVVRPMTLKILKREANVIHVGVTVPE